MSEDGEPRSDGGQRSVVSRTVAPVFVTATLLLSLVEVVMTPVVNAYNRSIGRFYGEMTGLQMVLLIVGLVAIIVPPYVLEVHLGQAELARAFIPAAIWAIFAMSWDIQSGYTGYISFGHSVLSGAAAYGLGMLIWHTDVLSSIRGLPGTGTWNSLPLLWNADVIVTMILGVLVALVVGLLIALPTLRLEGPYFSLITFVAVLLFTRMIPAFSGWTGGDQQGINLVVHGGPDFPLFGIGDLVFSNYLNVLIPMLLIAAVLVTISRSNVGLILTAIRENEPAVSAAGINPTKFKLWSFVVSSVPMGIGGVLLAHHIGTVSMQEAVIADNSIEMIAIAVLGGISSIVGPLFAAFGFILLEENLMDALLHAAPYVGEDHKFLFLWLLVILVLIFARNGLFRLLWHLAGLVGGDSK